MASLKDIKRHISAVKQTQKLTKAMNMVAAAKLRSIQNRTELFRFYAEEYERLLYEVGCKATEVDHPLLHPNPDSDKALIVVLTSDRGLCGSFNSNVLHQADSYIVSLLEEGLTPELYLIGRKGVDYYNRRPKIKSVYKVVGATGSLNFKLALDTTDDLLEFFTNKLYRKICLCSTFFKTLTRHVVEIEQFLPIIPKVSSKDAASGTDYVIEPAPTELLSRLIPRGLSIMIYRALLESVTSENAARMQAMDNASKSCKDIIVNLTMSYNKARQAAVTNELLDIVNGAEALKG
jgi:F-type H+-transporting ATPase subunit gamma